LERTGQAGIFLFARRTANKPSGNGVVANSSQPKPTTTVPQGDKSSYTGKQIRQARHIEASYEKRGLGEKAAEGRAWATVNKLSGGGKKSGSGRKKS
jgi:hypothetical protein